MVVYLRIIVVGSASGEVSLVVSLVEAVTTVVAMVGLGRWEWWAVASPTHPRPYELCTASPPPPPPPPPPDSASAADEDEDEDELDLDEDDDRAEAAERRVDRDALEVRDEREWTLAISSAAPAVRDLAGGVSGVRPLKSSTPVGESGPVLEWVGGRVRGNMGGRGVE